MISQLWEFFFCPVHGIFRPDNLLLLLPALAVARGWIVAAVRRFL
jgi:hypothetical protein